MYCMHFSWQYWNFLSLLIYYPKEAKDRTFISTNILVQIAKLQDDNRALDRLTKSKEAALLEAERTIEIALAKASMVDDLQNKNQELMKQIEICQVKWKSTIEENWVIWLYQSHYLLIPCILGRKQNLGQIASSKDCWSWEA